VVHQRFLQSSLSFVSERVTNFKDGFGFEETRGCTGQVLACCKPFLLLAFVSELIRNQIVIGLFVAFGGVLFG
jgi:hypothetical protein